MMNKKNRYSKLFLLIMLVFLSFFFIQCGGEKQNTKKTTNKSTSLDANKAEDVKIVEIAPEQLDKAKEILQSVSSAEVESIDARKTFKNYCALCHGIKGNMKINGATDLTKSIAPLENSVAQIYHGRGMMTPFKGVLKDPEIVAVAKYIEKLR